MNAEQTDLFGNTVDIEFSECKFQSKLRKKLNW
jgi:hypothetical protein